MNTIKLDIGIHQPSLTRHNPIPSEVKNVEMEKIVARPTQAQPSSSTANSTTPIIDDVRKLLYMGDSKELVVESIDNQGQVVSQVPKKGAEIYKENDKFPENIPNIPNKSLEVIS